MRYLSTPTFLASLLFFGSSPAWGDALNYDYYGATSADIPDLPTFTEKALNEDYKKYNVYLFNSETNSAKRVSAQFPENASARGHHWQVDPATKKLYVPDTRNAQFFHVLDPLTNTWTTECENDETFDWSRACDKKITDGGFDIDSSFNTSLSVGDPSNPTVLSSSGISGIISHDSSTGITSLGENSFKFQETATEMKLWATNSSGEIAPINITNGTKLLINGRDVDQAIDNVGALSAALTGLPTVPEDSPLSCGLGVGAHSGSNAFSGGCASKVNERLTLNYAASIIPAKQDYQGTDNSWSGRAGFVFKLGKIHKPTLISMKEKKGMQSKISELSASNTEIKAANEKIQSQNKELQAKVNSFESKNQELRNLLAMQNERLEKIEQIALSNQKDEKTAFSFLNASNLFSRLRSFLISSN